MKGISCPGNKIKFLTILLEFVVPILTMTMQKNLSYCGVWGFNILVAADWLTIILN